MAAISKTPEFRRSGRIGGPAWPRFRRCKPKPGITKAPFILSPADHPSALSALLFRPRSSAMTRYLILPGWQGSGPEHWQTHWQRLLPDARRVEQDDWQRPDPQRWVDALDQAIASSPLPVVLIAHSLGCVTVARWAASAPVARRQRVLAALLVAPADVERPGCPAELVGFAPLPRQPLPFPSRVVTSDNDHAAWRGPRPWRRPGAASWTSCPAPAISIPARGIGSGKRACCSWRSSDRPRACGSPEPRSALRNAP